MGELGAGGGFGCCPPFFYNQNSVRFGTVLAGCGVAWHGSVRYGFDLIV